MSLLITTENMESDDIPTGDVPARCYQVYDLGLQASPDNQTGRREVVVLFELDALRRDGKPFTISKRFTASMHPKASLRKFIEAWRGRPYLDEEVQRYELEQLVGKYAVLTIALKPTASNRLWKDIFNIRPRGETKPFMTRMAPGYVPEWVRAALQKQLHASASLPSRRPAASGTSENRAREEEWAEAQYEQGIRRNEYDGEF
jgi:hypothetical protein